MEEDYMKVNTSKEKGPKKWQIARRVYPGKSIIEKEFIGLVYFGLSRAIWRQSKSLGYRYQGPLIFFSLRHPALHPKIDKDKSLIQLFESPHHRSKCKRILKHWKLSWNQRFLTQATKVGSPNLCCRRILKL